MAHLCGLDFFWDRSGGSALSSALEPVFGYSWGQSMTVCGGNGGGSIDVKQ